MGGRAPDRSFCGVHTMLAGPSQRYLDSGHVQTPRRPPFTHHKQTPHTAAAAARARCRAATPLEARCNERSTYIHPQGTVVTARYAQNALLWPGTRQTAANSQQRPSGGPLTATARAAIPLVLRSNPRGTNPSLA